jgi:hypothetical protein
MSQRSGKKSSKRASGQSFKIIVEKYCDGYIAYPLGINGVVVGEGDTYEEVMSDAQSAVRFHLQTFGQTERILMDRTRSSAERYTKRTKRHES